MGGLFAKLLTVEIVQIVVVAIVRSSGTFLQNLSHAQGFPALGRLSGLLLGWPGGCSHPARAMLGCWVALLQLAPFPFIKQFLILASRQTCKFNTKICRDPKIVKLILLGSKNYDLSKSTMGSRSFRIILGLL
jgi:hypothetical protein